MLAAVVPCMVEPSLVHPDPMHPYMAHAEIVDALMKSGIAVARMVEARMVDVGVVGAGTAGFRRMRPRERRSDFKSRRNDAGESPGEGCSLDGTTLRRVLISQYQILSRFVAVPVQSGRHAK
jgi:hypothetical protein